MSRRFAAVPTIKQVALRADVSVGTVSRVLNDRPDVNEELRHRVQTAIRELRYKPNARARSFTRERSNIIAFVLCNGNGMSTMHSQLLLGIEEYCSQAGYSVLFTRSKYKPGGEQKQMGFPGSRGLADCFIVAGNSYDSFLAELTRNDLPHIALANHISAIRAGGEARRKNQVRYDDFGGYLEAAKYLIQLGHRQIWFIGDTSRPWFRNRLEGYATAMRDAGLAPQAHTAAVADDAYENGLAAVSYILEHKWPVTAVLAGSEDLAFGAREALRQHGKDVPRDVSLIGFEHERTRVRASNITSVCVDASEVGRQLARMAIHMVERPAAPLSETVVPAILIKRSTCRPLRIEEPMVL